MWDSTKGFVPVGDSSDQFDGQFDGKNHTISNLFIDQPSASYIGLFGYAASNSRISNVGVVDADISADGYSGADAGVRGRDRAGVRRGLVRP